MKCLINIRAILLVAFMLFLPAMMWADKEPWVEYADGTLTFHYDENKYATEAQTYSLNTSDAYPAWLTHGAEIKTVVFDESFAQARPTSCYRWFYKFINLTSIEGIENLNTSEVTTMREMFYECRSLTSLNLKGFDTRKVTTMNSMFADDVALTYITLSDQFTGTSLKDANWLFASCKALKNLDLSSFETTDSLTSTQCMFMLCSSLTRLDLSGMVTSHVTDMSYMFASCKSLTSLDLSCFHTDSVTTMSNMFAGCTSLISVDLSSFNTEKVTDMSHMFNSCKFKDLNLTYFDTKNVKNMRQMFYTCSWLCRVTVSSRFVTDQVTESTMMFYGCSYLPSYDVDSVDKERAKVYLTYLPSYPWVEYQAETNSLRFRYDDLKPFVTATAKYDLPTTGSPGWVKHVDVDRVTIDKSFKEARPVSCHEWFYAQQKITEIEGIENLCTDSVTTMEEMFYLCTHLEKLDLSGFNTERVTTMNSMFYLCQSLTDVQVRSFNTEKVTDMSYMFLDCRKLKELDLTSFDTKNVTNMNEMFDMIDHETNLEHIYVSEKFVTDQLLPYYTLFFDCEKLPNYVYGKFDKAVAHYKEGGYLTLRRQFSVGETQYNVDDYVNPTCYTDVDFTDGAAYSSPTDFTFAPTNYATYTRKVSNHWATLCLPFAFSAKDDSPSRFYSIESYNDGSIVVKQFTDTIPAGTPVLAYVTGDELNVSAVGTAAVTTPVADDELQGVFTQTEVPITDYFISNDRFWSVFWLRMYNGNVKHVYVSPYRAFLTLGDIPPYESKPDSIGITEDAVTGVIDPSVSLRQDTDLSSFLDGAELYDLEGRRLTAPQRGMMIIRKNGVSRKVVIR